VLARAAGPARLAVPAQEANVVLLDPARREGQGIRRGRIEPLDVVDGDDERLVGGQRA
jgi:hypothetical protein